MFKLDKEGVVLLGYSLKYEVLILIGVLYLIIFGHTLCGCCKLDLTEEFNAAATYVTGGRRRGNKEGFVGANTNRGLSAPYNVSENKPMDTSSWFPANMTVTSGQAPSKGVQDVLNRPSQPVPLPEGEMLMFSNTPFKPECCPNSYSNSTGCACMTTSQYNHLINRGGNNVPYSEY